MNMFDVNSINSGFQNGMRIGRVNGGFASLGDAFGNVLNKYDAHIAAQQSEAAKRQTALDVQTLQNQGTATAAGVHTLTPEEQAMLNEDRDNPVIRSKDGATAIRNTDIDSKGHITTKWSLGTVDPLKQQRADEAKAWNDEAKARAAAKAGGRPAPVVPNQASIPTAPIHPFGTSAPAALAPTQDPVQASVDAKLQRLEAILSRL
jgi:hypothetical protein